MQEKLPIEPIPYYMIISKFSGKVLDAVDQNVRLFFAFNTPTQQWCFEHRGNGYFSIVNRSTHEVLDVHMAGVDNGTLVHTWTNVNADNQLWQLEPLGNDFFRIRSKSSGRYLDIVNGSPLTQAGLHIWDACKNDTQLWLIKRVYDEPLIEINDMTQQQPQQQPQPQTQTEEQLPRRRRRRASASQESAEPQPAAKKRAKNSAAKAPATGRKRGPKPKNQAIAPEATPADVPTIQEPGAPVLPEQQPADSAAE